MLSAPQLPAGAEVQSPLKIFAEVSERTRQACLKLCAEDCNNNLMESIRSIRVARNGDRAVRGRSELTPHVRAWCVRRGSSLSSSSSPLELMATPSTRVWGFLVSWGAVGTAYAHRQAGIQRLCWQRSGELSREQCGLVGLCPAEVLSSVSASLSAVCLPTPRCLGRQRVVEPWACLEITSSDISDESPFPCSRELRRCLLNTLLF